MEFIAHLIARNKLSEENRYLVGELSDREMAKSLVDSLGEKGIQASQEYYEFRAAYRIFIVDQEKLEVAKEHYLEFTGLRP